MKIFLRFFHCAIFLSILGFGSIHAPKATANDSGLPENFTISGNVTITHISDGDSLQSGKLRIRLFGIDAPEKKQKCAEADGAKWDCGAAAQKALTALVASAPQLQCDLIDVDRYGRVVMRCFAGKTDLGSALVRAGLALAYRQYSSIYSADEESAKTAKLGMWAGAFTAPWAWRRSR
jgi:endonuclease YncB( thermonuclease family)